MAEVALMTVIFLLLFDLVMLGNTSLAPNIFLSLAVLDLNSGLYACKVALYCLSYIISPF
jgi:hypothetical protein